MAAALNDVIRLTVNQRQAAQLVQNVFYYRVVTITGLDGDYLQVVADWFEDEIYPELAGIMSSSVAFETMLIQNVTNGIDFKDVVFPPGTTGGQTGSVLPPNVCFTFRLLRETLVTRHGYKRFAGVPEASQDNGVFNVDLTPVNDVEAILAADIQPAPALIPLFAPVIVRRNVLGVITAVNDVGGCDFRGIGTQNTRKIGRGV